MSRPRILIVVEGGLLQNVCSSIPMDYCLIDYDTDGCDEAELSLSPTGTKMYAYECTTEVNPQDVEDYFNVKKP